MQIFLLLNGFITNIQAILLVIALIVWRIANNSQNKYAKPGKRINNFVETFHSNAALAS